MTEKTKIELEEEAASELKLKDLRNDHLSLDNIMDDTIGLNIQGFKSLFVLCFKPAGYFQAAQLADWGSKYRPSFRLLFAILALTAATRFLWASDASPLIQNLAKGFEQDILEEVSLAKNHGQVLDVSDFNSIEAVSSIYKKTMLFFPFAVPIGFAFFAWAYRAWGEKFSYVIRLRYTYAVLVPSMALELLFSLLMILTPENTIETLKAISATLSYIIIALIAYLGPFRNQATGQRIWRSICLAVCSMVFYYAVIGILLIMPMIEVVYSLPMHDHSLPLITKTE